MPDAPHCALPMPRPAQKDQCRARLCRTETDAVGRSPMPIHEYLIRNVHDRWEVRLGGRLVSGRSTRLEAVNLAECLAQRAAAGGQESKVVVADPAGDHTLSFPAFRRAAER